MVASEKLLVRPRITDDGFGEIISFTPEAVGWDHLGFRSIKIPQGESIRSNTRNTEIAIVVFGGKCSVTSSAGSWSRFGRRKNVFAGLAHTLYLSIDTEYVLIAETDADIAICSCPAEKRCCRGANRSPWVTIRCTCANHGAGACSTNATN